MQLSAAMAQRALRKYASKERAKTNAWFFKTNPGQYGYGDSFLGVRVPDIRRVAKEFGELPFQDIRKLLQSRYHEERLLAALLLVHAYAKGDTRDKQAVYTFYMRYLDSINSWDIVDASAAQIVGATLLRRSRRQLDRLARSASLWRRRVAIVATYAFIRDDDYGDTLRIATLLMKDREDLIQKATGWMLREVGKRSPATLRRYLDAHAARMPRTMLRYAIEKFSSTERARYLR